MVVKDSWKNAEKCLCLFHRLMPVVLLLSILEYNFYTGHPSTQLTINILVNTLKDQLVSVVHSTILRSITKSHRANYPAVNTSIYLYNVC